MNKERLIRNMLKHDKEFFRCNVMENDFKFDYEIYNTTIHHQIFNGCDIIKLNARVSNYKRRNHHGLYLSPTTYSKTDVWLINSLLRSYINTQWRHFFSIMFNVSPYNVEVGTIKHTNLKRYGKIN